MHNILVREKDREMAEDDNHLELGTLLKRKVIPEEPPPLPTPGLSMLLRLSRHTPLCFSPPPPNSVIEEGSLSSLSS